MELVDMIFELIMINLLKKMYKNGKKYSRIRILKDNWNLFKMNKMNFLELKKWN